MSLAGSVHAPDRALDVVRYRYLTTDKLARVLADVIMVNVSLLLALTLRFLWLVGTTSLSVPTHTLVQQYVREYVHDAPLLTLLAVAIFAVSGFYSRGRVYRGRYKALAVAEGVSLAYLAFAFCAYLGLTVPIPRGALILAWLVTLVALLVARLWSMIWKALADTERVLAPPPTERKVRTVLVIGGDGYIGSALLPRLLARGYRVRILSLLLYGEEPIQAFIGHPRLEVIQADFRQVDRVVEAMRGVDAVVHLGAIVGDPACALDEQLTIDVNVMATKMIAEVAKGHGVNRFIFASTCSVYGASDEMLDEHSALRPVSLYARSKIACERILMGMASDDFAPVCLRFGTIYGLSGRTRFDLVVNLLSAKALVDGVITVAGGDQWRPFLHVEDAAQAVFKALEAPLRLVRGQVYNVGSNEQNYTIGQVGEMIHALVPDAELVDIGQDGDRRNYCVNFARIRHELQFQPAWTLEAGITQVLDAIRSGKVGDYRDARYSNVKFLSEEGMPRLTRQDRDWVRQLVEDEVARPLALPQSRVS